MESSNIELIYELSSMQQAMLFHSLYAPGSGVYVIQMSLRLTGRLDVSVFERAWQRVIERHAILRTAFFWEDLEKPLQVVYRQAGLEVARASWSGIGPDERKARLSHFLESERDRGFDLAEAPLMRLALFELEERVHQMVWTLHHVLVDGWSQGQLLRELFACYAAFSRGEEPRLAPAGSFREYISWLQRQDLSAGGKSEAFWRQALAGFTTPTFLAAGEDPGAGPVWREARRRDLQLPAGTALALREAARRHRLTLNTLVQGAWSLLLAQASGREDVAFGTTVSGRPANLPGVESILGLFINTQPMRVRVPPGERLWAWLAALQERQVEMRRHEHSALVDVQRWSELPAGVPLFDHLLVFENVALPAELARPVPELAIAEEAAHDLTNYPLNVVAIPGGAGLLLSVRWDARRFAATEAVRMLERLAGLLTDFAADRDVLLEELPLLLDAERHQVVTEWNDTADGAAPGPLMHQLFEAQVDARPEAPAAVFARDGEEESWTYRELEARANSLAHCLGNLGSRRGTPVGVWMERSLSLLATVLGILKAGGTYVPLDPAWPAERVETILAGTGAPVIVADRVRLRAVDEIRWRLPRLADTLCLDAAAPEPGPERVDADSIRSLFDFVAERATDRVSAGGFVSRVTGLPFSEAEVDEYRDRVLSLAAPWLHPGARVLEVGSGSGLILWEMAKRAARCVGLDPSERSQERNREHARAEGIANVELPVGFAHEIAERFAPGSFDLIVLASTVQFFPGPRYLEAVVADALRLLAPGGALLLADVIDARRERETQGARVLRLDEELFHDFGAALPEAGPVEVLYRTAGFANELGERYDVILRKAEPGVPRPHPQRPRRKRTWTGWHVDRCPATRRTALGAPEDIAYVIYTSGSTGAPKGIAVQHAPAVLLIDWINRTFGVGPGDRLLFITSLCFDLSVYDVFGVLAAGATVQVASEAALREPEELVRLLCEEPVTIWDSAPAALQQLAPLFPPPAERPLRLVLLSGDWIPVRLPDQVRTAFPGARVVSLGGATEATVWSNWYPVGTVDPSWPSIPYGRPIADARYHVLDAGLRPCPLGVPGDLYIGGACLCVGYLGQPELTAASFVPDPFAALTGHSGARLYRTGDRARFFEDGDLEFLGRVDQQVKIRGYRIELGEIEVALLRHEAVRECVVVVRDDRLVAYVVLHPTDRTDAKTTLAAWLRERLPQYMLPSVFVLLDAMPVTPNGKLDRQALPAPELGGAEGYEAPSGAVEEILADLWAEILGRERVSVRDSFFTLGGHSLLATQLMSRVRGALGVELPLRALFDAPTVAELARTVLRARLAGTAPAPPPLVPVPRSREADLPLSSAQQRLWLVDQLEPGGSAFNIPLALGLSGTVEPGLLERILGEVVRRHEALRTTFAMRDGEPVQVIAPPTPFLLPRIDLDALPAAAREAEARRLTGQEAARPFDLARGPLLRAALVRLDHEEHLMLLALHHIVSDFWSMGVLVREVSALYGAFSRGLPSPLPELPVQYADFAAWQRGWMQGEVLAAEIAWWRQRLAAPAPPLYLGGRERPETPAWRGAQRSFQVPPELSRQLAELSRREGATLFMTLFAGLDILLYRRTGQTDLAVGTDIANRNRAETEGLIGFFVNLLVLRTDLSGGPRGRDVLARVREVALEAYAHQDVPFDQLVRALRPERSLAPSPLFDVLFVLQNVAAQGLDLPGLRLRPVEIEVAASRFDLALFMAETPEGISGRWVYKTDLYDAGTIDRLTAQYIFLLEAMVRDLDVCVDDLELPTAAFKKEGTAMEPVNPEKPSFKKLLKVKPRAVQLPEEDLVRLGALDGRDFPLLVEPNVPDVELAEWAAGNQELIDEKLSRHGAILFRGFQLPAVRDFEKVASAICPDLYGEYGDLPREKQGGSEMIYESTPYPPDKTILFHNESSHMHMWPLRQFFYCAVAAEEKGETPIVDCRRIYERLDPALAERFAAQGLLYVRNFTGGLDVSWQEFFHTDDRAQVEAWCGEAGIECEWRDGDRLRTRKAAPAVAVHPKTGEKVFFNQLQLHHVACLEPEVRESLQALFADEDLPRNVRWGDGAPIEDAVVARILETYWQESVAFRWREGDLLALDNMLVAHARNPYRGARKIAVAMGRMVKKEDLPASPVPVAVEA